MDAEQMDDAKVLAALENIAAFTETGVSDRKDSEMLSAIHGYLAKRLATPPAMDAEQREKMARELLAEEIEREANESESAKLVDIAELLRDGENIRSGFVMAGVRAIARALAQPAPEGWRPIETAPRDGTVVLLFGRYWSEGQGWMKHEMVGQYLGRHFQPHSPCWVAWGPNGRFAVRPTHWRPTAAPEPEGR